MKKILFLLIATVFIMTSYAQGNYRDDRYSYNEAGNRYPGHYGDGDRAFRIEKINREIDFRIRAIQHDYTLRRHQKKVAIRNLERERVREIRMVNAGYHDRKRGRGR